MHEIGIERLCVFGMPPVEFVMLAADLGCSCIGTALTPMRRYNPHGYVDWSLRDDAALRLEMIAALRDRGVRIALLEGFGITPGRDVGEYARDLDLLCELKGERINVVNVDRDLTRGMDGFARLASMAAERGLQVSTEVGAGAIPGISQALELMRHVAMPNVTLLIDTMHFFRLGGTIAELARIDPVVVGYVQLCDAPRISSFATYLDEALHDRLVPGEGDLPLREFLEWLRTDVIVSLEVPRRVLAEQGVGPKARIAPCISAARALLDDSAKNIPQGRPEKTL